MSARRILSRHAKTVERTWARETGKCVIKQHSTPWGAVTSYTYQGLTTQIDHPGLPPSFSVIQSDALGRPVSVAKNVGVVTSYEYGPFGALRSVTDPGGATTSYVYDSLSRPAATILSINNESFEIGVGYDQLGRVDTT